MSSVTVGGPGFVAVGSKIESEDFEEPGISAVVWTSVDGITWSRVPHDEAVFGGPGNKAMNSVTAGGPGLVAIGVDGDNAGVWTSVDGFTWSRVPHDETVFSGPKEQWMNSVTVGGPGLVAVGYEGQADDSDHSENFDAAVWTSVDGLVWSRVAAGRGALGVAGGQDMSSVTTTDLGLVAVGHDWTYTGARDQVDGVDAAVWTSPDGTNWSRVEFEQS